MPAEFPLDVLLAGIARGRGGSEMMLELLAILHGKGLLSEAEVRRVVNVLTADMQDFTSQLRQGREPGASLKG